MPKGAVAFSMSKHSGARGLLFGKTDGRGGRAGKACGSDVCDDVKVAKEPVAEEELNIVVTVDILPSDGFFA